jgi:hypothetical protein
MSGKHVEPDGCRGVAFASCYVYSPHGSGAIALGSRRLRVRLKQADPCWFPRYAARVCELVLRYRRFGGFFDSDVFLVPVPGSVAGPAGSSAVTERLAIELLKCGLGGGLWPAMRRRHAVRKSATAAAGRRPTVFEHRASLTVIAGAPLTRGLREGRRPRRLLLIDDFVTKGRTLLAAAATLREALPEAEVRAFALARTLGHVPGLEHLVAPCEGEIRWVGGDAQRTP